ncbi:hypothetical protein ASPZODRAFT_161490 [Penicilliopsis zonata CBS 506.65]|uniref:non-specific serine/threonine protein kinase n=1 Tax=Penicilliopsis zonata CBS 506.65 TaxID=1073090 RepID=A0A1L9S8T0_9EURO|nr:hypothetical protein ASPZODRAFT_161490 [Penicilliopsis zonata CBS 506.65]OJJ43572.1 hypothetical protein ASPZODRAFT_161490 [Penicilliopsis zonata CBS 506.65]
MTANHRIEYNWIKGVETLEEYQPGGYHPVMIDDLLHERYRIVDKLGFGGYSTVWLAQDTQLMRYVAVKVNTADSLPHETTVLKALSAPSFIHPGHGLVPSLLDEFRVEEISFSRLFPLKFARALSYRLAQAVAYTHSRNCVHGDIHLSNILIRLPSSFDQLSISQLYEQYGEPDTVLITRCDGGPVPPNAPAKAVVPLFLGKYAEKFSLSDAHLLLLCDFGEAFSPATNPRLGKDCHTPPAFRAPEAKFEPQSPLTYSMDIWSLATAIWEIMGMKAIFSTDFVPDDEIVSQHVDVLGPMPSEWWQTWKGRSRFFHENGSPTEAYKENRWPCLKGSFEVCIQKWRQKIRDEIQEDEKAAFLDLMRHMLSFRPQDRPTAAEVLLSDWMVKWASPDYSEV